MPLVTFFSVLERSEKNRKAPLVRRRLMIGNALLISIFFFLNEIRQKTDESLPVHSATPFSSQDPYKWTSSVWKSVPSLHEMDVAE